MSIVYFNYKGETIMTNKRRVMWWNLPPEEIDELSDAGQLKTFTCVEYDDESEDENN